MSTGGNFNQNISHKITGLGDLNQLQKVYEQITSAQLELAFATSQLSDTFKQQTVFKGLNSEGQKVSNTLKQVDGTLTSVTTSLDATANATFRQSNTLKFLDAEGRRVTETLKRVNGVLVSANTVVNALPQSVGKATITIKSLNAQGQRVTSVWKNVEGVMYRVRQSIDQVAKSAKNVRVTKELGTAGERITRRETTVDGITSTIETIDKVPRKMDAAAKATGHFHRQLDKLRLVQGVVIGSLLSRAIAELTNSIRDGITTSAQYALKLGEIQTVSQDAQLSTENWSVLNRQLSDSFNIPILDIVEGTYQTLSNQIAHGAEATQFMSEAQRLGIITAGTTAEAVNVLSSVINSYNLSVSDAREISDSLFRAVELGRFRLQDIAQDFGSVTILGNQLGVTYKELEASLVILTRQGVEANTAMTFMRQVFNKLAKPTKEMTALLKKWGVSTGKAAIDTFGFTEVLSKIKQAADESGDATSELSSLFDELRGFIGITGLTTGEFASTLNELETASGRANNALEIMRTNIGLRFQADLNRITNFFTVELGPKLITTIVNMTEKFGGAVDSMRLILKTATFALEVFVARLTASYIIAIANSAAATRLFSVALLTLTGRFAGAAAGAAVFAKSASASLLALPAVALIVGYEIGDALFNTFLKAKEDINLLNQDLTAKFWEQSRERITAFEQESNELTKNATKSINEAIKQYERLIATIRGKVSELSDIGALQIGFKEDLFDTQLELLQKTGQSEKANRLAREELDKISNVLLDIAKNTKELTPDVFKEFEKVSKRYESVLDRVLQSQKELNREASRVPSHVEDVGGIRQLRGSGGGIPPSKKDAVTRTKELERRQLAEENEFRKKLLDIQELFTKKFNKIAEDFADPKTNKAINERINTLENAKAKLVQQVTDIDKLGTETKEANKAIEDFLTKVSTAGDNLKKAFDTDTFLAFGAGTTENLEILSKAIESLSLATSKGINTQNLIDIQKALIDLQKLDLTNLGETGAQKLLFDLDPEQAANIQSIISNLAQLQLTITSLSEKIQENQKLQKAVQSDLGLNLEQLSTKIQSDIQKIVELEASTKNLGNAGASAVQQVFSITNTELNSLFQRIQQIQILLDNVRAGIDTSEAATKQRLQQLRDAEKAANRPSSFFGRYITRQAGGSIGRDSQLGLFDPREFIASAKTTSKFLPQLVAMNSGSRRFDAGGPISNTNIGDINISVNQTGGQQIDARTLGNALRRELRRSTMRLT